MWEIFKDLDGRPAWEKPPAGKAAENVTNSDSSLPTGGENMGLLSSILGDFGEYTSQRDVQKQYKKQIGQILQNTQLDIQQTRTAQGRRLDLQRANYGKAGVKMTGSAVDLINEQIAQDELELLSKRYEAKIKIGDSAAGMRQAGSKADTALGSGFVRAANYIDVNKGFGIGGL